MKEKIDIPPQNPILFIAILYQFRMPDDDLQILTFLQIFIF